MMEQVSIRQQLLGRDDEPVKPIGKTDSIHHHHHLKGDFETATVLELRQKPLYTTPSGWWWCIESVFRETP